MREKAVGPNEGSVRPRPDLRRHDSAVGTGAFVVKTNFALADGSAFIGYCSPVSAEVPAEHVLGYLAPAIVTDAGQVPFWFAADEGPRPEDVLPYYATLEREVDHVFPVSFEVAVPVADDEVTNGVIEAFWFLVYRGGEFRLKSIR